MIVHGYEEWQEKFVNHLKGMFGIAILDLSKEQLYLARDLAGEKPLFYTVHQVFAFASEIKPLLHELPIPKDLDPLAIDFFLRFPVR